MNELRGFEPLYLPSVPGVAGNGTCPASTTVAASNGVAVASTVFAGSNNNQQCRQLRVANKTNMWVHINFGNLTFGVTAATINSQPFAPGSVEIVTVHPEVNAASVFSDGAPGGSTSVVFTRGQGT